MSAFINFNDYTDDNIDIVTQNVKLVNVLTVGLTGSGKSSIIKSLCSNKHKNDVITEMSPRSVTKNIRFYEGNQISNPKDSHDRYVVNMFDTVGLGTNEVSISKILKEIIECMPKKMTELHQIVFCFKMDRLRMMMSEELNIMYHFFKMLGAKSENFVICLTFCDTLKDQTISSFWNELKESTDLEMVREIETVIYTVFPNLDECDHHADLVHYLEEKMRRSRRRLFDLVVSRKTEAFYPNENMIRMPNVQFKELCSLLLNHRSRYHWFWSLFQNEDQEELIECLKKRRIHNSIHNIESKT